MLYQKGLFYAALGCCTGKFTARVRKKLWQFGSSGTCSENYGREGKKVWSDSVRIIH